MPIKVQGIGGLEKLADQLRFGFSPETLLEEAMLIARQAGVMLLEKVVSQCVDEIYAIAGGTTTAPTTPLNISGGEYRYGGLTEERTNGLFDAHEHLDDGLKQIVRIDPEAQAIDPHSGREYVSDYAAHVHDGYEQWVMGRNTGVYHIGRPWFDHAVLFYGDEITGFVVEAFTRVVERAFN